jgi:uncharacterized coiled-coil DUF342 family protein
MFYRSESSSTNFDESKRIKSLINDLQNNLKDSQNEVDNKLESMKASITVLQTRFTQIENRFDRWVSDMKDVSVLLISFIQHHCSQSTFR